MVRLPKEFRILFEKVSESSRFYTEVLYEGRQICHEADEMMKLGFVLRFWNSSQILNLLLGRPYSLSIISITEEGDAGLLDVAFV